MNLEKRMSMPDLWAVEALIKARVSYDSENGLLIWKQRAECDFPNSGKMGSGAWKSWNTRFANKPITAKDDRGYILLKLKPYVFKVHRVVWFLHYGEWPSQCIDHINRVKFDNRISNLRDVSPAENSRNIIWPSHGGFSRPPRRSKNKSFEVSL